MLVSVPGAVTDAERYRRALRSGDVDTTSATVQRRWKGSGRGKDLYVDLRLVDGEERTVEVYDGDGWRTLDAGDELTVTRWDGSFTRLHERGGVPVETIASPLERQATTGKLGLILVPWSAFGIWYATRLRRLSGGWRAKAATPLFGPSRIGCAGVAAFVGASVSTLFGVGGGLYDLGYLFWVPFFGALAGATFGLAAFGLVRLVRRLRSRSGDDSVRRRRRRDEDRDGEDDDD